MSDKESSHMKQHPPPSFLEHLGLRRLSRKTNTESTDENCKLFRKRNGNSANRAFYEEVMGEEFENMELSPEMDSSDESEFTIDSPMSLNIKELLNSSENRTEDIETECEFMSKPMKNMLKLSLAHRWVVCEFLYADIDLAIFEGQPCFRKYLAQNFEDLDTFMLTKQQWRIIRQKCGRPRRLSPAFLNSERLQIECKRCVIRLLQQKKYHHIKTLELLEQLPAQVPMPLPAGTKVIARLDSDDCGLSSGTIVGYDAKQSVYFVKCKKPELSMHRVPDYKVFSRTPGKMVSLRDIANTITGETDSGDRGDCKSRNDCSKDTLQSIALLETLAHIKSNKVQLLSTLNDEYEQQQTHLLPRSTEQEGEQFQRRYVSLMVTMHRLNYDALEPLSTVHEYMDSQYRSTKLNAIDPSQEIIEKCRYSANFAFEREIRNVNIKSNANYALIKDFHTLLKIGTYLSSEKSGLVPAAVESFLASISTKMLPQMSEQLKQMSIKYLLSIGKPRPNEDNPKTPQAEKMLKVRPYGPPPCTLTRAHPFKNNETFL